MSRKLSKLIADFESSLVGRMLSDNPRTEKNYKAARKALRTALSEAEQRARREALEEAAKIAEDWRCSLRPGSYDRLLGHQDAAKQIADKIREDLSPASEREQPEKYRNPGIFHDAEGRN